MIWLQMGTFAPMWITGCTLFAGGRAHCTRAWTLGPTPLNQCWKLYHVQRGAGAVTFDSTQQNLTPGHLYIITSTIRRWLCWRGRPAGRRSIFTDGSGRRSG